MEIGLILPMGEDRAAGVPASYAEILGLARRAEAAGLDSVWVYDHLLTLEETGEVGGPWEAWTMLAALAADTSRVTLGTLVTCTSFRHPGVLAKMAHTVQEISGGRLVLGLGAGWHEPEYRAFGFPYDRRVDRFAEALAIVASLMRHGRATAEGEFYQVEDAVLAPPLTGDAGGRSTPVLVAGRGERMLRLTARWADAWNAAWFGAPTERFTALRERLRAACAAEGRDPATLAETVGLLFGAGQAAQAARPAQVPLEPAAVADALAAWADLRVAQVICWPDPTTDETFEMLCAGIDRFRSSATTPPQRR